MKSVFLGLLIGGMAAWAADAGGSAVPVQGMSVNGAAVPATGAKSWPVRAGDEVRTAGAPTVLTLRDGSKVVLGVNTAVRLDAASGGGESLRLVSGGMRYTLSSQARTQLVVDGKALTAGPGATGTAGQLAGVGQTGGAGPTGPSSGTVVPSVFKKPTFISGKY
jgi:ferric-dicitrate binding protein FerR (iron transport regulator)